MSHLRACSRRTFLEAATFAPAAWFALRAAAAQTPATMPSTADLELTLPLVAGAPPLRLLGKRIFNCYKFLASIAPRDREMLSAEEKPFAPAAQQLHRVLDPFDLGIHQYFEFGMIDAGTDAELLAGLERQARLFSAGMSAVIGQALERYEKEIWPRHRALIQESFSQLEKHFGSEQERLVATLTARLGFRKFPAQFTASLVVPRTMRESSNHPIVLSLTQLHGSDLAERLLEEMIHELAFENADVPGVAEVLLDDVLARKQVAATARLRIVRLFESWVAGDLVRERVDAEHVPTAVRRQQFETLARAHNLKLSEPLFRSVWQKYLEAKVELPAAMEQLADAIF